MKYSEFGLFLPPLVGVPSLRNQRRAVENLSRLVTNGDELGQNAGGLPKAIRQIQINGRHVGTRTPDLYRVNFEVNNPKPFPYLAFPLSIDLETARKWPSLDGELMASFLGKGFKSAPGDVLHRLKPEMRLVT